MSCCCSWPGVLWVEIPAFPPVTFATDDDDAVAIIFAIERGDEDDDDAIIIGLTPIERPPDVVAVVVGYGVVTSDCNKCTRPDSSCTRLCDWLVDDADIVAMLLGLMVLLAMMAFSLDVDRSGDIL